MKIIFTTYIHRIKQYIRLSYDSWKYSIYFCDKNWRKKSSEFWSWLFTEEEGNLDEAEEKYFGILKSI